MPTYLITMRTYGTWLHGDPRTYVTRQHNQYGTPMLPADPTIHRRARKAQKHAAVLLGPEHRFVVHATIIEVCAYRKWYLHAQNVRTNHAHVIVSAEHSAERTLADLKAYTTRRLREAHLADIQAPVWSYHGSTPHLFTPDDITRAKRYVLEEQGEPLPMTPPEGWRNVPRA
jgi:REP element-mobilizing transposase RayT